MRLDFFLEHALSPITFPFFIALVILYQSLLAGVFEVTLVSILVPIAVYAAGYLLARIFFKNENVYFALPTVPAVAVASFFHQTYQNSPILMISVFSICSFFILVIALRVFWKISMHMVFGVGAATILSILDLRFALMYALMPAVAWCRLSLKRHTHAQLAAGSVAGFLIPIAFGFWIGLF
jgi:hypothetical protein